MSSLRFAKVVREDACWLCAGRGLAMAEVARKNGRRPRPCSECDGTGVAYYETDKPISAAEYAPGGGHLFVDV